MVLEIIIALILILFGPTFFISLRLLREGEDLYAFSLPSLVFLALIFCYVYIISQPCTECDLQIQYANILLSLSILSFLIVETLLLSLKKFGNYTQKNE